MRDYYPLVARAVSRLEQNTPGARQALFDHLRLILIDQLRIRQPSASTTDVVRERAALEAAIQKIQPNSLMPSEWQTSPPHAPKIAHPGNNAPSPAAVQKATANVPTLTRSGGHLSAELAMTADDFGRRQDSAARARANFADQQRLQQEPRFDSDIAPSPAAIEHAIHQIKPRTGGDAVPFEESALLPAPKRSDDITTQQTAAANEPSRGITVGERTGQFPDGINTTILDNLTGIQLLDRLILDASNPLAPDSLKQDAETVLKWLGVGEANAIKTEHYDQFGRAIRTHMKAVTSSPRPAAGAMPALHPILTDDVSRVFDRLLDEQQSAVVFDKALTWFADIWIKLVIALNFIVIVGLLALDSAPGVAIIHLLKTYSPFNAWTWIAEVVALSPALGAIAWRERRLTGSWHGALLTIKLSLLDLLSRQMRKQIATEKKTRFQHEATTRAPKGTGDARAPSVPQPKLGPHTAQGRCGSPLLHRVRLALTTPSRSLWRTAKRPLRLRQARGMTPYSSRL